GLAVGESLLRAHPDLVGIACSSGTGGPSLARVLQGPEFKDRIGKLKIVAFDDLDLTKQAISDSIVDATVVQRPVQMGVHSIQWAHDVSTGKADPACAVIDTGVTVVANDHLDSYTK
ncbi:MAG TPA: substrate-binding domain-containing protein, partial [Thermomicrobiales bacterium]|nr:substrate-binding domain-containing protein [Thermomicrobiales bacterium]